MSRKKRENVMENIGSDEIVELNSQVVLNELALGISKTNNGWAVVEIAYNSETGDSDLQDVHLAGNSKEEAIELFKITAVERGLV